MQRFDKRIQFMGRQKSWSYPKLLDDGSPQWENDRGVGGKEEFSVSLCGTCINTTVAPDPAQGF